MILTSLRRAIANKDVGAIREIASELPIADVADALERLTPAESVLFFRLLNTETQSDIFANLEPEYQEQLIRNFTNEQIDEIVGDLYAHEIADLVEEVPAELQTRIISSINDKETREKVNRLLKFEDNQIGSVMNVDFVPLKINETNAKALKSVRAARSKTNLIRRLYVLDEANHLAGQVVLDDLVFGSPRAKINKFIAPSPSINMNATKEEAAQTFAKYDSSSLPVVNSSMELVGVITADDMIDVVTEIATEDALKGAGITTSVVDSNYATTSPWRLFRSRAIWLILLMVSATISQIVLDAFQGIANSRLGESGTAIISIGLTSAIVAILPVISGAAGNAGSQSATMIIRAMAVGDITVRDYKKVLVKELGASTLMGIFLAIANFIRLLIYYAAASKFSETYVILSLGASLALFFVIILAHIVGGMLPLLAKVLRIDPAVMAAPLLTTAIDALSIMIFFGISIGIMLAYL